MEITTQNSINQQQEDGDFLSLREILEFFLNNWKWFVFSAFICVGLMFFYLATKPNVYQREAVILVKDDSNSPAGRSPGVSTDALMQLNGVMMGSNVQNEVYILQTHQLMVEVVKKLRLDVSYTMDAGLKTLSLYDVKPFEANFLDEYTLPVSFTVTPLSASEYRITDVRVKGEEAEFECTGRYGEEVNGPFGRLVLQSQPTGEEDFQDKEIIVSRAEVSLAAAAYRARLSTSEVDKMSTLVRLVFTDTNTKRADDVLHAVLEAYKQSIIADKNQIAQSTAAFLNERVLLINKELSVVEGRLASFKQKNKLVDIEQNARAYLDQGRVARERSIQLESQVSVVKYLCDFLKNSTGGDDLIPSLGGVGDAGIQSQIMEYNKVMLQRNRLIVNSGEDSPVVAELDRNLAAMRKSVLSSMEGYMASLNVQLAKARKEEDGIGSMLHSVPDKEQQALDIAREQAIKETLYTYLLQKREETALQLAITEANIRLVEPPYGVPVPIAPRRSMYLLVALLVGLALPIGVYKVYEMLNVGVRGRKEIEAQTTIPILGEIPRYRGVKKDREALIAPTDNDPVTEAFRILRFNLDFVREGANAIMFTSTTPGEGKTFVSRNFAAALSMTGKRVVLLDADIRKRTQSHLAGHLNQEGLTSYLNGSQTDLKKLIRPLSDTYNIDFLPAGILPPNPAELLMSSRLETCVAQLKEMYDFVVIDNVPAQVVADAAIVNRVADLTLYVIRDRKLDRRFLPELQHLYEGNIFNRLYIVINDSHVEAKRYGYGNYGGFGYAHHHRKM